jgi:hypothetical protein
VREKHGETFSAPPQEMGVRLLASFEYHKKKNAAKIMDVQVSLVDLDFISLESISRNYTFLIKFSPVLQMYCHINWVAL